MMFVVFVAILFCCFASGGAAAEIVNGKDEARPALKFFSGATVLLSVVYWWM